MTSFGRALMVCIALAAGLPVAPAEAGPLRKGDRVVFVGDSITEDGTVETGFQSLLKEWLKVKHSGLEVRILNAGVSGDMVADVQKRFERDVLAQKPTVVVICIGINDVWRGKEGTPKDRYEVGLRDLVRRVHQAGGRVVLCTPSAIGERKNGANDFDKALDEYAATCRSVATDTKATLCDLRRAFVEYLKAHNPNDEAENVLTKDGVHLNETGNRLVAEHLAHLFQVAIAPAPKAEAGRPKWKDQPAGPAWFLRDGDRLYWNGSSHSQDEGWQCSLIEFYLRTRFPQWKITSGRGGPTDVSAAAYAPIIDKLKPTVVFCEFGYYGGDDQVDGVVKSAEKLAALCQDKKVRLVMMPSAFRAAHIDRLPNEYKGLNPEQIASLNARKQQDGTLAKLGQEVPVEIHEKFWRMRGAPGCDKRVAAMQAWGDKAGVFVPRSYQDQRDWLFQVWEKDPKFPWGGGHPPIAGYVAVGYFLLQRMDAPIVENRLVLDVGADRPAVKQAVECVASDLEKSEGGLRFKRLDKVLPVAPPLPCERLPRDPCPVLKYSPYFLTVTGLARGDYEITVEGAVLGRATQDELAAGVNLNEVYLRSNAKAAPKVPWMRLWLHCRDKNLDKDKDNSLAAAESVGRTAWGWELRRVATK